MPSLQNRVSRWWADRPLPTGTTTLYVDWGIVPCPRQGDISIEACLACPHLQEVDGDPVRRISCHPGVGPTLQDVSPAVS